MFQHVQYPSKTFKPTYSPESPVPTGQTTAKPAESATPDRDDVTLTGMKGERTTPQIEQHHDARRDTGEGKKVSHFTTGKHMWSNIVAQKSIFGVCQCLPLLLDILRNQFGCFFKKITSDLVAVPIVCGLVAFLLIIHAAVGAVVVLYCIRR